MTKEKNLKDYFPLYLGCPCMVDGRPAIIDSVSTNKHIDTVTAQFTDTNDEYDWAVYNDLSDIKPLLRPLSDMTEEECDAYGVESDGGEFNYGTISSDCIVGGHHHILEITRIAEITRQLCKAGFDCFELIDAGLAIDKTTLQTKQL
jgi:hypothetical protein